MAGRIERVVLRDGGVSVSVLTLGAIVQDWRVPLKGEDVPVVLGHADPEAYRDNPAYLGAIVGRVANRIGGAAYRDARQKVQLTANDGPNQLHGGPQGLAVVHWDIEALTPQSLRLSHVSPDGANGFPGAVRFRIDMRLDGHRLTWDMHATADRETPISLAQHNYYNLMGKGTIRGHRLRLAADRVLDRDFAGIMTGGIHGVSGTTFDLRRARPVAADTTALLDDFLIFDPARNPSAPVAEMWARNGLRLRLWSDQAGAQIYTGHGMATGGGAHEGQTLGPCAGLCIEPSGYPNAVNRPAFPSVLHGPDRPYRQTLTVEIAPIR